MLTELRITGLGGQGVIRFGYLLGKTASIYDGKQATMTQSFGPEARGSACSSQVVISDDRVLYFPKVKDAPTEFQSLKLRFFRDNLLFKPLTDNYPEEQGGVFGNG